MLKNDKIGQRRPQERLQQSTVEQAVDNDMPQITEKTMKSGSAYHKGKDAIAP